MAKIHKLQSSTSHSRIETPSIGGVSLIILSPDVRAKWGSRLEFLLSCIGMSVGVGNIWRFPYMVYKHGGAAFLIPYTILLTLVGKPMYFMEIVLGQFSSLSAITVWRCCPVAKGIGWGMSCVTLLVCIYYNVVVAYAVYFVIASFATNLPWSECDSSWANEWCYVRNSDTPFNKTIQCAKLKAAHNLSTESKCVFQTASEQYWERHVLHIHESEGIHDLGILRWDLSLCLLGSWIVVYLCIVRGIKSSGKVVYFTATSPYVILIILLIRGVTLEGAEKGLKFLFIPDMEKLLDIDVWRGAAEQMFYSLGLSWGVLIMLGSYNDFYAKSHIDAFVISFLDYITSLLGGITIFSVLGYLANELDIPVKDVAKKGQGLAFIIYPEAVNLLPIPQLWSVLFFLMLFMLGLDSQFATLQSALANVLDEVPFIQRHSAIFTAFMCLVGFLIGLLCVTNGGQFIFMLLDSYAASTNVLVIAFLEMVAVMWIYGVRNFTADIDFMLGTSLGWFWFICWALVCPMVLGFLAVFGYVKYESATYDSYIYPLWAEGMGICISCLSLIWIPIFAIVAIVKYFRKGDVKAAFQPVPSWGPANPDIHHRWVMRIQAQKLEAQAKNMKKGAVADDDDDNQDDFPNVSSTPADTQLARRNEMELN